METPNSNRLLYFWTKLPVFMLSSANLPLSPWFSDKYERGIEPITNFSTMSNYPSKENI